MFHRKVGLILIVVVIVIAALINIYKPYVTTHPTVEITKQAAQVIAEQQRQDMVKQVRQEFADITEESLIKHNSKIGAEGFNTNIQALVSNSKDMPNTRLVVNEGFDTTVPIISQAHELRLFYRPDCTYSNAFMPVWLELAKSLPSNVTPQEINCGVLDANGVSTCANWLEYGGGITSVPAVQLVSNISGVKSTKNYSGSRSYQQLKSWLSSNGITLKYNPNAEHFQDSNPMAYDFGTKEGFSDDSLFEIGTAHGDHGKAADDFDKAFLTEAQEDAHGHIRDIGKDGYYKATFSTCQPDPQGPEGYQVFTRRGQWGCVVPDPNSGISTPFDAAFAAVDSYLSMIPPITDPSTGKLTGATRTADQRMAMKRGMAAKHAKDIRAFGLCDEARLKQKYNTYEMVKSGKAKLPDGVSLQDYLDTQESAAAIYGACSTR
jgi:hypothetical protein